MVSQEAPVGQVPVAPPEQTRMQYWLPEVSLSAQVGVAVVPSGTSVGQVFLKTPPVHLGMQASPLRPWIFAVYSSAMQPPVGLP